MLKYKLFRAAAFLVIVFSLLYGILGVHLIKSRIVATAQSSIALDLVSAWSVYRQELREVDTVVKLQARNQALQNMLEDGVWEDAVTTERLRVYLEKTRHAFGLHFLTVAGPDGQVRMRAAQPYAAKGFCPQDPLILQALKGAAASGTTLLSLGQIEAEAGGLAERAFMPLEETPRARPTTRKAIKQAMVMLAAGPVEKNGRVVGVVYGGIMLNRNAGLVDEVADAVFHGNTYRGMRTGTVTIFQGDARIATTVRTEDGNRAYGTRVSKAVADRVLDNGRNWVDRAFVVNDWYLTAYDPIHDAAGEVIGMLYVGTLEKPFLDLGRTILSRFMFIAGGALLVALIAAFIIAGHIAKPLQRLSEAALLMVRGQYPEPLPIQKSASRETASLIGAFNEMAGALQQREHDLKEANHSLTVANANYMETVQFVSHELKRPVASMVNYVYMLKERLLGPMTEKQEKAATVLDSSLRALSEMIRHYLNLARIENNELRPHPTEIALLEDIVTPVLDSLEQDMQGKKISASTDLPSEAVVFADRGMCREVFDNLLSNAVKYGREDGRIEVKGEVKEDGRLRCIVWNEGVGVTEEEAAKLFAKFERVGEQKHADHGKGTGLGLFISKQIVEAHGGTITVESVPGEWIQFVFSLPLVARDGSQGPNDDAAPDGASNKK